MATFPSADGFGKNVVGGRGGIVTFVTNLNDSGAGSLRAALESSSARIVVIMVNGTIELLTQISFKSNKTLLGMTSNGDGICIKRSRLNIIDRSNIVIRFFRSRFGDESGNEGTNIFLRGCTDVIVDHSSFSWGTDETLTTFKNSNVTFQWCLITEPLNDSVHSKGPHGYAWFLGGKNISVHHCFISNGTQRNPRPDNLTVYNTQTEIDNFRGLIDFRNNVVYNWQDNSIHGLEGSLSGKMNLINNYLKKGPNTRSDIERRLLRIQQDDTGKEGGWGKAYADGNIIEGESDINADNWIGIARDSGGIGDSKMLVPFPADVYDKTDTAEVAKTRVLSHVGCSLSRDSVDTRAINQFNTNTGAVIDSQLDVGGYPILTGGTVQSSFDNFYNWLIAEGFTGVPPITDYTNSTQLNDFSAYVGAIDEATGYAIVELYANDLVADLIAEVPIDPEPDPQSVDLEARLENGSFGGGTAEFTTLTPPVIVPSGTIVEILATPFDGFEFVHWVRNGLVISETELYNYTVPAFNSTLIAVFRSTVVSTAKRFRGRFENGPVV